MSQEDGPRRNAGHGISTRAVHDGEERRKGENALTTPIYQTSTYVFGDSREILDYNAGLNDRFDVIMVDDIINTASSMMQAAAALKRLGAKRITAGATHALFSEGAVGKLAESAIEEIVITNTLSHDGLSESRIKVLSVAELLGEAIDRIHGEKSVSSLFV